MTQPGLFDPIRADAEKVWGMNLAAEKRGNLLEIVREYLTSLAKMGRLVSADDAYAFLERNNYDLRALGPAAGHLFGGDSWQFVLWVKSKRTSNRGRFIRAWRLKLK